MTRERLRRLALIQDDMAYHRRQLDELESEYIAITAWMDGIECRQTKAIMRHRYSKGRSWMQIATQMGGYSPDSIRMMHNRYLDRQRT